MASRARPLRILVDVDSTLYDADPVYLKYFASLFGVQAMPVDLHEYNFWKGRITVEQFLEVIVGLHDDAEILAAVPYAGAVDTLRAWASAGVEIHIVSDRKPRTVPATMDWLARWNIPFHAVVLEHRIDKVGYAQRHGISLLIDDKPGLLTAAIAAGLDGATILHAYNRATVAADPRIIGAEAWPALRAGVARRYTGIEG